MSASRVGLAWRRPGLPGLDSTRTRQTPTTSIMDAELDAMLAAPGGLSYETSVHSNPVFCSCMTPKWPDLCSGNRSRSPSGASDPTYDSSACVACIPRHMAQGTGNQAADDAAQESLQIPPPLVDGPAPPLPSGNSWITLAWLGTIALPLPLL